MMAAQYHDNDYLFSFKELTETKELYPWCHCAFGNVSMHIVEQNTPHTLLDSQFENTPRHPCDSHFPKGISALSWSFLLENWNKTNVYEMITHYTSCQQCRTLSNSVNSVNSVNTSTVSAVSTVIARCYLHL